ILGSDDDRRQVLGQILAAALALAFQAKVIEGTVARHSAKPGDKRAATGVVLIRVAPKLQENVLHNFFRGGSLLENAQDEPVHEARVTIVELFKGAHVSLKKTHQQRRVRR